MPHRYENIDFKRKAKLMQMIDKTTIKFEDMPRAPVYLTDIVMSTIVYEDLLTYGLM